MEIALGLKAQHPDSLKVSDSPGAMTGPGASSMGL
jgi:hypothetical protein